MKNILLIGAGRCAYPLIDYITKLAPSEGWFLTVGDAFPKKGIEKVAGRANARAVWLDATKVNDRRELIGRADVVISLLPAHLHLEIAHDCIKLKKTLLTSSYVSHEIYRLGDEARDRELFFTEEKALAPGIDELAAKRMVDQLRGEGAKITAFRAYSAGLMADESTRNNPWEYKITWNPRNIVLAGQGTAQYLDNNKVRYLPYGRLFKQTKLINIPGVGELEAYLNRDALLYTEEYGLEGVPNIQKLTLRKPGFSAAWDALVQLGLTDADFPILQSDQISYYNLLDGLVGDQAGTTLKERTAQLLQLDIDDPVIKKLQWLGLFSKKRIRIPHASPALILEHLLREKWILKPQDKDRVIVHHEIDYQLKGQKRTRTSTMVMQGEAPPNTAMAKHVSLPIGILLKPLMNGSLGQITGKSIQDPTVYHPILNELEEFGISFEQVDTAH